MDLFHVDLFTSPAGLMAKLVLKDRTFLYRVEEWKAQTVSNISSVSYLCLLCVSTGVVSTAECRGTYEAKGEEEPTQTILRKCRKYKKRQRAWVTVFWRSTDFTAQSVVFSCSIKVKSQNERPKNEYNSSPLNKLSVILKNAAQRWGKRRGWGYSYISRKDWVRWGASGQINWRRRPLGLATLPARFGQGLQCLPEIRFADMEMCALLKFLEEASVGACLQRCCFMAELTFWNCLNGTNCTMSRMAASPVAERKIPSSPSRNSMAVKSAPPTPTMMMDMGRPDALTIAFRVSSMSVITPSVMMRRTKYCCETTKQGGRHKNQNEFIRSF